MKKIKIAFLIFLMGFTAGCSSGREEGAVEEQSGIQNEVRQDEEDRGEPEETAPVPEDPAGGVKVQTGLRSNGAGAEAAQTYWEIDAAGYKVALRDLVPGLTLELVIRQDDGEERTALVYRKGEDYEDPVEFSAEPFERLLGHDGFCLYDQYMGLWYTRRYYALEEDELICLADGWGWEPEKDHMVDLDGDGDRELICNVAYIADGAQCTLIYRNDGERVLYCFGDDLLDQEYDNYGVGCEGSEYLPEENVIRIWFWKDALEDFEERKYEIDMERLEWWSYEG